MAWTTLRWLNFRQTAGLVTDGTNQVHVVSENSGNLPVYGYPNPATGNTIQVAGDTFEAGVDGISSGVDGVRDRDSGADPRLAGVMFFVSPTQRDFHVSLGAARTINLHLALGQLSFASHPYVEIYDNTSLLETIDLTGSPTAAGEFYDTNGTLHTAANWVANQAGKQYTISTGELILRFAKASGSDATCVTTIGIQEVSGATGTSGRKTLLGVGR